MKKLILFSFFLSLGLCAGAQALKKSVTWEQINCHPAPLPVIGTLDTPKSDLSKASRWSVGCETMDRDYADFEKFKQYVGETGVGYARLQSGWAKTEQKKGEYDFAWLDKHVDGLLEQGVHPWLCLCYGNPVYSDHGHDLSAKLFEDGPIMDGWLKYVEATVKHYKGKITMYEVWNEPDKSTRLDSYGLYANLFIRTAKIIRKIDPDAKIAAIGACTPDRQYIRQFLQVVKDKGQLALVDYITYHSYWPVPETVIPAVEKLRKDVAAFSPKIGVLQGETGCPGQLEYGHAMKNIEWNEYSQAKWDLRSMMNHFAMDIPYSVFTMVDLNYGWMVQSFGLIRTNLKSVPQYKRPKFYGVQHMASVFTAEMTPDPSVTVTSECGRKLAYTGIKKGDKTVGCAVWMGYQRPNGSLEREIVDIHIQGITFKKPVYVDMLDGKVYSFPEINHQGSIQNGQTFITLPLWDSPVLIIEKDAINYSK